MPVFVEPLLNCHELLGGVIMEAVELLLILLMDPRLQQALHILGT